MVLTKKLFSQNTTIYVSVTSNHHQADISVHGHDMFNAYSKGSHIVNICCVEFHTIKVLNIEQFINLNV